MTPAQRKSYEEWTHLIPWNIKQDPVTLIETIDFIKELRRIADKEQGHCDYDPHNHTADGADAFRTKADEVEADMEKRIGWQ